MSTSNRTADAWGQAIAAQRAELKMSRAAVADTVGVSRAMVGMWERGEHAPSSRMQGELIAKLGIDPVTVADLIRTGAAA